MEITETLKPADRAAWRAWLECNHDTATQLWLVRDDRASEPSIPYFDAVEEANCFGWIDGIVKRPSKHELAIRSSPRRLRSHMSGSSAATGARP